MNGRLCRFGAGLLATIFLATNTSAAVLNSCDEGSLRAAINAAAGGDGVIIFNCDGTIVLGSPLVLTADTVLDGREHNVTISGNDQVRIIEGVNRSLTLYDLTLRGGVDRGTNGAPAQPGGNAGGGAILLRGGGLYADGCDFIMNRVTGGRGGDGTNVGVPPIFQGPRVGGNARGGAILAENATVTLTNCSFVGSSSAGGTGGAGSPTGGPVIFAGPGTGDGGVIWIAGGSLTAAACRFEANSASSLGGAIYASPSHGGLRQCTFNRNAAGASGGAMYYSGTVGGDGLFITSSRFYTNSAFGRPARGGAILHVDQQLIVNGCLFAGNAATGTDALSNFGVTAGDAAGGGLCSLAGTLNLSSSTFTDNQATGGSGTPSIGGGQPPGSARGGGLYLGAPNFSVVRHCTFANNRAAVGGGWPTVPSSTITAEGGALVSTGGIMSVSFSTIASNAVSGPTGSTVRGGGYATTGVSFILESSIVCGNTTNGGFGGNGFGSVAGHASGTNLSSDASVPFSRANLDARLFPLADNGGPVPTMALRRDSPAIDTATSPNRPSTDARGARRPQKNGIDIGAYEQAFLSIEKAGAGTVRIRYEAPPIEQYALEGSIDLRTWQQRQTGFSDNAGHLIFDRQTSLPSEMVRVRLIP